MRRPANDEQANVNQRAVQGIRARFHDMTLLCRKSFCPATVTVVCAALNIFTIPTVLKRNSCRSRPIVRSVPYEIFTRVPRGPCPGAACLDFFRGNYGTRSAPFMSADERVYTRVRVPWRFFLFRFFRPSTPSFFFRCKGRDRGGSGRFRTGNTWPAVAGMRATRQSGLFGNFNAGVNIFTWGERELAARLTLAAAFVRRPRVQKKEEEEGVYKYFAVSRPSVARVRK